MKVRKLNDVIFFAVTLIVFSAGTFFTFLHRADTSAGFAKENVLAAAAGCFLTVAELALILLHKLIDSRELWRRVAAYTLSLGLASTITYATYTEAAAYLEEGGVKTKTAAIAELSKQQQSAARGKTATAQKIAAINAGQATLKGVLSEMKGADFAPFAINFFFGLFCILTAGLIQPREPWRRRSGNQMSPELREKATQIGFNIPANATAYDDGKGTGIIIKDGRRYVGTIPKSQL